MQVKIQIPEVFQDLFAPARYKVFYGGRGGAKSWGFAMALLVIGMQRPTRILCARELQTSIADSVHKLLADQINACGLSEFYEVQKTTIRGKNGTEFLFKGLKHNATEIKSTEGVDICWVEEAEKVSAASWELLIPTIRKERSEIWVSFNPKYPTDATYVRFVERKRADSIVRKVSWRDNPFFPDVLEKERRHLEATDPKAYDHIWEGNFDERYFGGVYAKWVAEAYAQGRVTLVPALPGLPVNTAWDLGFDDSTAIWWWQLGGRNEVRLLDYYEASGEAIEHYCAVLDRKRQERGYVYGRHYAPHDAANQLLAAGGRSIVQQAHALGVKMHVVPATSQQNGIEAARATLRHSWFDETRCADGLHALKQYQFEWDEERRIYKSKPRHDFSSHGSDAFEIIGQVWRNPQPAETPQKPKFLHDMTANDLFWGTETGGRSYPRI